TEILRKGARLILKGDIAALRFKADGCVDQAPEENSYDPELVQAEIVTFSLAPKISVIVPVYNVVPRWLDKCIESVLNQSYSNWELCLLDDCSTNPDTLDCLRKWTNLDPRILVSFSAKNGGISVASNVALAMATGEFVALMDHDDELHPHALFEVVKALNKHPDADMIFTDEDKIVEDKQGATQHFEPFYKPGWNPQLTLSYMYVGHLTVYRKAIIDKAGGFRSEFDFSQDYDLALRVTEITDRIQHIPKVLYHWRAVGGSAAAGDKPYARASNMAALRAALKRRGYEAEVTERLFVNRVKFHIKNPPMVSMLIVSEDQMALPRCLESISRDTNYPDYEIITITRYEFNPETLQKKGIDHPVRNYLWDEADNNLSIMIDRAVRESASDYLLFLSDMVEPVHPDWLTEMVGVLERKEVAACSPKLYCRDGTILYAGLLTSPPYWQNLTFQGFDKSTHAYFRLAQYPKTVSVLSRHCLLIKKEAFDRVGGLNPGDADFSLKLINHGYELVYMPYAELLYNGDALTSHPR
ncbi:MAG: glycosyltransferase, partial [Desulfomonilaceae bacterium]